MRTLLFVVISITALFFVLLGVKEALSKKWKDHFCAICIAVSLTWITLLALYWLGRFDNVVMIALLIGQSIHGVFVLAEKKVKESLTLFRLPFLLTLIVLAYALLIVPEDILISASIVVAVWVVFLLFHTYRSKKAFQGVVKKILECCMNW